MLTRLRLAAFAIAAALPCAVEAAPARPLDLRITHATRVLLLSPHPDDVTLAAAGLIQRVVALGGAVRVVQVTSGDAFPQGVELADRTRTPTVGQYRAYGWQRERETIASMESLGVRRADVLFLGFPDEGLCDLASTYRSARTFVSPYTRRESPPPPERLARTIGYRGRDVDRELEQIIAAFAPTLVVMPDGADEHPDHCSTHILGEAALSAVRRAHPSFRPRVLTYLIHYGDWPAGAGAVAPSLLPPSAFDAARRWVTLALTPAEAAAKTRAVSAYATQMLAIGSFMHSFERVNELFLEGEPRTANACWCDGVDVAARPVGRVVARVAPRTSGRPAPARSRAGAR